MGAGGAARSAAAAPNLRRRRRPLRVRLRGAGGRRAPISAVSAFVRPGPGAAEGRAGGGRRARFAARKPPRCPRAALPGPADHRGEAAGKRSRAAAGPGGLGVVCVWGGGGGEPAPASSPPSPRTKRGRRRPAPAAGKGREGTGGAGEGLRRPRAEGPGGLGRLGPRVPVVNSAPKQRQERSKCAAASPRQSPSCPPHGLLFRSGRNPVNHLIKTET